MTLTTWDEALCRVLEPGVCSSQRRVEVLRILRDHGIPTVVWLTPILPYINDTEENLLSILSACAEADVQGIICFGMGVTMREGNREYFYEALDRHFPGMKDRYIRSFGLNYQLISPNHRPLMKLFHGFCRKHGIIDTPEDCFRFLSEFQEKDDQISFFDI
jgi:DNA repair photolyase